MGRFGFRSLAHGPYSVVVLDGIYGADRSIARMLRSVRVMRTGAFGGETKISVVELSGIPRDRKRRVLAIDR
jgi:hypothetical protein